MTNDRNEYDALLWVAIAVCLALILAVCLALIAIGIALCSQDDEEEIGRADYCKHVHERRVSRGRAGWPDFYHTFDKQCGEYTDAKR
jgi:hypothetical protein